MLEISISHSEFCKHSLVPWAIGFDPHAGLVYLDLSFGRASCLSSLWARYILPSTGCYFWCVISVGPIFYCRPLRILPFLSHYFPTMGHHGSSSQVFWKLPPLRILETRTSSSRFVSFDCSLWPPLLSLPFPPPDTVTAPPLSGNSPISKSSLNFPGYLQLCMEHLHLDESSEMKDIKVLYRNWAGYLIYSVIQASCQAPFAYRKETKDQGLSYWPTVTEAECLKALTQNYSAEESSGITDATHSLVTHGFFICKEDIVPNFQ